MTDLNPVIGKRSANKVTWDYTQDGKHIKVDADYNTDNYYPYSDATKDQNYVKNQSYVTPLISGALGGLVGGIKGGTLDMPLVGNIDRATATGILTAAATYVGEVMEYFIHPWFRIASYRNLGLQVGAPIYSGAANVGLHILAGNNEGVDPLLFTPVCHYTAKMLANRFIFPSYFYEEVHKTYLPQKVKDFA